MLTQGVITRCQQRVKSDPLTVTTNGLILGLPQLGWNLSGQRTHHPSPQ